MKLTFKSGRRSRNDKINPNKSISKGSSKMKGTVALALFFGIFLLAGAAGTYFLFIRPLCKLQAAKSWPQVQCVITSSQVGTHSGEDGNTYSVDIHYSYTFNGRKYKSDNYNFSSGSSSGRAGKQRVVSLFPSGSKQTCYVNPAKPQEASLTTKLSGELFFGLIPLVFLIVGLSGIVFCIKSINKKKTTPDTPDWMPDLKAKQASNGQFILKSRTSPKGKFIGILIFFTIWSVVVYFMIQATVTGSNAPPIFMTVIFALVDLGVGAALIHSLLALFNARPIIIVNSKTPRLGDTIQIAYMLKGRTSSISNLKISLEGSEEATYQRGTKSHTDKRIFKTIDIVETESHLDFHSGVSNIAIPTDTMHSFEASNNKIIWNIAVKAEIDKWPDIKESFYIALLPREA